MSILVVFIIFLIGVVVFVVTFSEALDRMPAGKDYIDVDELPKPEGLILGIWNGVSIVICVASLCMLGIFFLCSHEVVVSDESSESIQYELLRVDNIKETEEGNLFYVSFTKDSDAETDGTEKCYILCTGEEQTEYAFAYLDNQGKITPEIVDTSDCILKYDSEAEVASVTVYRSERTRRDQWWCIYGPEMTNITEKYDICMPKSSNIGLLYGRVAIATKN